MIPRVFSSCKSSSHCKRAEGPESLACAFIYSDALTDGRISKLAPILSSIHAVRAALVVPHKTV